MEVTIKDILPLINTNDIRLLDSNEDEIALIYQGYNVGLLSDETLRKRVTGIWNDECRLWRKRKNEFRSVNPDSNFNNGGIFMCLWNCKQDLYMR